MVLRKVIDLLLKHKITIIVGISCFILGILIVNIFHVSYSDILEGELSKYDRGRWVVTIGGDPIGEDYLDKRLGLYKKHIAKDTVTTDPILKDKLLRKLVDNFIVLKAAKKTDIFSGKRANEYLWLFLEEAMVNYYLDFLVNLKSKKNIEMSDAETNKFYEKNKKMFEKKDIPKERALVLIKKSLNNLNDKFRKQNRFIARKIELGKIKKGKKIIINKELLKKDVSKKKE